MEARGVKQIQIRTRRSHTEYEQHFSEIQEASWFQEYAETVADASATHITKAEATRRRLQSVNIRWAKFHANPNGIWHHFEGQEWAEDSILRESSISTVRHMLNQNKSVPRTS